jgi:hypothetical protein
MEVSKEELHNSSLNLIQESEREVRDIIFQLIHSSPNMSTLLYLDHLLPKLPLSFITCISFITKLYRNQTYQHGAYSSKNFDRSPQL